MVLAIISGVALCLLGPWWWIVGIPMIAGGIVLNVAGGAGIFISLTPSSPPINLAMLTIGILAWIAG